MPIATYENNRFTVTDSGDLIVLRSKMAGSVAIAFGDWDAVSDVASVLVRGLSPQMRRQFLIEAFSARELKEAAHPPRAEGVTGMARRRR